MGSGVLQAMWRRGEVVGGRIEHSLKTAQNIPK